MTRYRVTWTNTDTGEACGISVKTMVTACNMASTLQRATDTKDIVLSVFHENTFNEAYLRFQK